MIHVVLDTSIFTSDRKRYSGPFRALMRLCKGKKVQLHVPYFVKNEFVTQQEEAIRTHLKAIREAAEEIRIVTGEEKIAEYAGSQKIQSKALRDDSLKLLTKEFDKWLKDVLAIEYPVGVSDGIGVSEDYFNGELPFKSRKNRKDFPDAFVWQTILQVAKKEKTLHVVANDSGIYDAAKKAKGMVPYKTLAEFVDSNECQAALAALDKQAVTTNAKHAGSLLKGVFNRLELMMTTKIVNALDGKDVLDDRIPNDSGDARVFGVNEDYERIEFDFDSVNYYGEGEIGVPFDIILPNCTVSYAIQKGEYYMLSYKRQKLISVDELNEQFFDAEEEFTLQATGTLLIKLDVKRLRDENISKDGLRALYEDAEYSLDVDEVNIV